MIMDGNFYIGTCAIDLTYKCMMMEKVVEI